MGSALSRGDLRLVNSGGKAAFQSTTGSGVLALHLACATLRPMELASKLRELLGRESVADDPETLAKHSGDKWFAAHVPEAVVFASSTSDVSKLLQFASREKIPVTARGGGFGY